MKMPALSALCALKILLLLLLAPGTLSANDNSQPLPSIGEYLPVRDATYQWLEATDDSTYRYDIYVYASWSVTVTTLLEVTSLALVNSDNSHVGALNGHWGFDGYKDNYQITTENGTWNIEGLDFTYHSLEILFSPDLGTGMLNRTETDTYNGTNCSYSISTDDSGYWSLYKHYLVQNYPSSSNTGQSSVGLFGDTYNFYSGYFEEDVTVTDNSSVNSPEITAYGYATDQYMSQEGFTVSVTTSWDTAGTLAVAVDGWDGHIGQYTGWYDDSFPGMENIHWNPRSGPSFAQGQAWAKTDAELNYRTLTWVDGVLSPDGVVTDTYAYEGPEGGASMVIHGNVKDFHNDSPPAAVSINESSVGVCHPNWFDVSGSGWDVQYSDPGTVTTEPFFNASFTLWVNGTPCTFAYGHISPYGTRSDTYINESYASLNVDGSSTDPTTATVQVYGAVSGTGSYDNGVFDVSGISIQAFAPLGAESYWVRGGLYTRTESSSNTFTSGSSSFTLSESGENMLEISGSDSLGSFGGTFTNGQTGVFLIQDNNSVSSVPVIPADAEGNLMLSADSPPSNIPPAIMIVDRIWVFLGNGVHDTSPDQSVAYYGSASLTQSNPSPWLLKIRYDDTIGMDEVQATYTNYVTGTSVTGIYHLQRHLFQTGATGGIPMPTYATHGPAENYQAWNLPQPEGEWPATFLIGGAVWRFQGMNGDMPVYQGYYYDQELTVGAADSEGRRVVTVTDPVNGDSTGILNNLRGSVRLEDGRLVYSGNYDGQMVNPTLGTTLHTIAGDLDITGSVISFGALNGNAAVAGATLSFSDDDVTASLQSALARPAAQWLWSRASNTTSQATALPVMMLTHDATNAVLRLYGPEGAQLVLTPAPTGTSIISSALEVRKDVTLLEDLHVGGVLSVTGGIAGNLSVTGNLGVSGTITTANEAVLTQPSADQRYVRSNAGDPITIANGATISGTVQFNGSFNAAEGATITGATQLHGDLTTAGLASIGGDATFNGATTMAGDASVGGALSTTGNLTANAETHLKGAATAESDFIILGVLDGDPEDNKVILQPNQKVLIPEAGDISMGEFRAGPLPVIAPVP
ncbi:MAG: hypothetical protein ACO1TE_06005 [Prosthecobacter sp.]